MAANGRLRAPAPPATPLLAHPDLEHAVWERAGDAMVLSDADGIVLAANPAYLHLYGYDADAVVGHSFAIIFPPEQRAWAVEQYRRVFADPASVPVYESVIRRADGAERVVESHISFVHANGQRVAMVSILRDITAPKRAEAALRASEERLRLVLESVQEYAIFTIDPQGRVTSWNTGARRITGYSADEILGHSVARFYPPEAVAAGTPARDMETALRVGRSEDESWRVRKGGARFWGNEIMTPLYTDDGTYLGFTRICRDLTTRKQAEDAVAHALAAEQAARAEAEAALATREHFLSIAAHELRTPLTALLGYAYLLPAVLTRGTGHALKMTAHITHQAQRLNTVVTQLLDVARLQRGLFALERQALDLAALVAQVVTAFQTLAEVASQHQMVLHGVDTPVWVLGDGSRLEQVLTNLLSNAVKYSPAGGTVAVHLAVEDGQAVLEVHDRGIGIPQAAQARLGEPFYRASNVGAGTSGFGLGLYLVHQIVARHGGQLAVQSAEGQGTTVRVVLPLQGPPYGTDVAVPGAYRCWDRRALRGGAGEHPPLA